MELRPARPSDALEVAGVHVRSWQEAYRGLLPDDHLAGLDPAVRAARYQFDGSGAADTVLAVEDGRVCGFATVGPSRDADLLGRGELMALYVDPPSLGTGVGRALIADARRRLRAGGATSALLWVLVGNQRAMRFYERDGWRPDGSRRQEVVQGLVVEDVRYLRGLADPPDGGA